MLATNSVGGLAAAEGLAGTGTKIGTFDLGPDVLKAVEAGRIGFAVDQQAVPAGLPADRDAGAARALRHPARRSTTSSRRARTSSRATTPSRRWSSASGRFARPAASRLGLRRSAPRIAGASRLGVLGSANLISASPPPTPAASCAIAQPVPHRRRSSENAPGPAAVIAKTAAISTALYS